MGSAVPGLQLGSIRAMEGAMPKVNRWSRNVPRIELDQRSREARLRLEEIERLVVSKQRRARLRRIFYVLRIRISLRSATEPKEGAAERSASFPHADSIRDDVPAAGFTLDHRRASRARSRTL